MPTTNEDIEKIRSLRDAASESTRMGADIGSTATTLHDNIMAAVRNDRVNRGVSQMAKDVGNVGGQLVTEPNMIREHGGDVANPMDIDRFTSQARASNMQTLGTIATQGEKNYGTLQEIIGAGANQLQAMAQNKFAEAQQKAEEANAMMEQLSFQEQIRQFNETMAEKQRQFNATMTARGGSGGSGGSGGGSSTGGEADLSSWANTMAKTLNPDAVPGFYEDLNGMISEGYSPDYITSQLSNLYAGDVNTFGAKETAPAFDLSPRNITKQWGTVGKETVSELKDKIANLFKRKDEEKSW